MAKDRKYSLVKNYIEAGALKTFSEIFDTLNITTVIKDVGINHTRLTSKIKDPQKFSVKDIVKIAQLIEIDSRKVFDLIASELEIQQKKKRLPR